MKGEARRVYTRPVDQSLQAYKDFILGMMSALNPSDNSEMHEAEWRRSWLEFWGFADDAPPASNDADAMHSVQSTNVQQTAKLVFNM